MLASPQICSVALGNSLKPPEFNTYLMLFIFFPLSSFLSYLVLPLSCLMTVIVSHTKIFVVKPLGCLILSITEREEFWDKGKVLVPMLDDLGLEIPFFYVKATGTFKGLWVGQ